MQVWNLSCSSGVVKGEYAWKLDNFPTAHYKPALLKTVFWCFSPIVKWHFCPLLTRGLLDRARTRSPGRGRVMLFLAAARSSRWQRTPFFLSFSNVAVLCKSSDLVFQLCNMNSRNTWRTSCIPPPPLKCFLNLSVFGVWFHVCIVRSEHLSQIL